MFFCKPLQSVDNCLLDVTIPTHKLSWSMDLHAPTAFRIALNEPSSTSQSRMESDINFPPLAASHISLTLSFDIMTWLSAIVPFIAAHLYNIRRTRGNSDETNHNNTIPHQMHFFDLVSYCIVNLRAKYERCAFKWHYAVYIISRPRLSYRLRWIVTIYISSFSCYIWCRDLPLELTGR